MRRTVSLIILVLALAAPVSPLRAEETPEARLESRILTAVQALRPVRPPDAPGRIQDLELFLLAEALESLGQKDRANQYRQYLRAYFPGSPVRGLSAANTSGLPPLDYFEPDPDLSRLVKTMYRRIADAAPPVSPADLADEAALLRAAAENPEIPPAPEPLEDFLRRRPDSPWAGWAAYQLLWRSRLAAPDRPSGRAFSRFAAEHGQHPLGEEAGEALDVRWTSPRRLALTSVLLPGLSEELLEPGEHESAGALYAEALYLAGAVAFTVAAQSGARVPNLTGSLIMFNLLMLNHSGSSQRAYEAGLRYDAGGRRRFIADRLERPVAGPGSFTDHYYAPPEPEIMANDLVVSCAYRQWGAGEALRGRDWIREEQLGDLGLRLEYLRSLWEIARTEGFALSLGVAPYARVFGTQAAPTQDSPLARGASVFEAGAGAEAALLARMDLGGSWAQVRLSLGPGFRRRSLDASGAGYSDSGAAATGTLALALGGPGGAYWQIGATADDSFVPGAFMVNHETLSVPSLGWDLQSSLGVHF